MKFYDRKPEISDLVEIEVLSSKMISMALSAEC
jgi:hypothetical protein